MSDQQPPVDPTTPMPAPVGSQPPEPSRPSAGRGRRRAIIAGVTAGSLAVLGLGAYAAVNVLSGGAQAEKALPASTLAVVSMDIDPGAKQKIEAIKTLRKFPELRSKMGVTQDVDLRKKFFEATLGDCRGTSWAQDVKPWIGDNVALAAVPAGGDDVAPVVAIEVTDTGKATRAAKRFAACGQDADVAFATNGDFMLMSDTQAHVDTVVEQAEKKALTEDSGYRTWSDKAGDRGIVNGYVAKAAGRYLADHPDLLNRFATPGLAGQLGGSRPSGTSGSGQSPTTIPSAALADPSDSARTLLKNFQGAAFALRFADSGMEFSAVARGVGEKNTGKPLGRQVGKLPADAAIVLALNFPKDYVSRLADGFGGAASMLGGGSFDSLLGSQLGLERSDLTTLLGQGLALVAAGDPPASLNDVQGPEDLPVGLLLRGDTGKINTVLDKLEQRTGMSRSGLTRTDVDGGVALSFDPSTAKIFDGSGKLADSERFTKVVPEADKAGTVVYLDFDSAWKKSIVTTLTDEGMPPDIAANIEPLGALGLSSWTDGGDQHGLLKITTD